MCVLKDYITNLSVIRQNFPHCQKDRCLYARINTIYSFILFHWLKYLENSGNVTCLHLLIFKYICTKIISPSILVRGQCFTILLILNLFFLIYHFLIYFSELPIRVQTYEFKYQVWCSIYISTSQKLCF